MSPSYAVCLALGMEALTTNDAKRKKLGLTTGQLYAFMEQHSDRIPSVGRKNWKSGLRHCLSGHRAFYQPEAHRTWRMKEKYLPKPACVALKRLRRIASKHPDLGIDAAVDLVLDDTTEPTVNELQIPSPSPEPSDVGSKSDNGDTNSSQSSAATHKLETPSLMSTQASAAPLYTQLMQLQQEQEQLSQRRHHLQLLLQQAHGQAQAIVQPAPLTTMPSQLNTLQFLEQRQAYELQLQHQRQQQVQLQLQQQRQRQELLLRAVPTASGSNPIGLSPALQQLLAQWPKPSTHA
eukprot:m.28976 g.28976  ORF g.28976 m.28976 type:complete len:292 (+) comp11905_c0_seq1:54-929(+)